MLEIRVQVKGKPVPQGSMNAYSRGNKIVVVHGKQKDLRAWRSLIHATVLKECCDQGISVPIDFPVTIEATFYLMPPKKKRFTTPGVKPDLDKLQRAVGDALGEKPAPILREDSRIVEWVANKKYADKTHDQGVVIVLRKAI